MRLSTTVETSLGADVQLTYTEAVALSAAMKRQPNHATLAALLDSFVAPRTEASLPFRVHLNPSDLAKLRAVAASLP